MFEPQAGGRGPANEAELTARVAQIAKVLRRSPAKVIALQEVGSRRVVDLIADAVGAKRFPQQQRVFVAGADPFGVAVLSAHPILRLVDHSKDDLSEVEGRARGYVHACAEVEVDVDGNPMVFLITHQAPHVMPHSSELRAAESRNTRAMADQLRTAVPSRPVVIAGDFNDGVQSQALRAFLGDSSYESVGSRLPEKARFTHAYGGGVQIDHIVVHRTIASGVGNVAVDQSPAVKKASDHMVVSAEIPTIATKP